MTKTSDLRRRLESSPFADLETMMEGYARAAADLAELEYQQKLDFT